MSMKMSRFAPQSGRQHPWADLSILWLVAIGFIVTGLALSGFAPLALSHPMRSFAPLVKNQMPRVVHIKTGQERSRPETEDPERFGPFRPPEFYSGKGTGFVVDASGLIITNHHVVHGTAAVDVVLANEKTYRATVVGTDQRTDLALVRIDAKGLQAVSFGDSNQVEVGDWVIAIGDPLGLDYSVTAGIISAKGRNIFDSENVAYGEFLQTDAAINPGNSGGPLFNLDGEVIGVNTAISSRGQGIGFAVPSNLVVEIIQQLRTNGRVVRGWLGVVIQEVTPEWVASVGLPDDTDGILVNDIVPNAPAAKSNLQRGDLIVAYEGIQLTRVPQLQKLVAFTSPGKEVSLALLRRQRQGGPWRSVKTEVRIGSEPGQPSVGALPGPSQPKPGAVQPSPPVDPVLEPIRIQPLWPRTL